MTTTELLDLPAELLTQIILSLPPDSILKCQFLNKFFRHMITNSVEIQYFVATQLVGLQDNPHSTLPPVERNNLIKKREKRWEELRPTFTMDDIQIPFPTSGIYDLVGGIYLLGESSRKALHYITLPTSPEDKVEWKEVRMLHTIIDMGLSVHEHDLLVVITTQPRLIVDGNNHSGQLSAQNIQHEIQLHSYSVSTAKHHPIAEQPVISVVNMKWERPAVGIEIVGDNLVLILAYYEHPFKPDDQVFVYDRKKGKLKMKFSAPYQTYAGLLFLTEDIILLPNTSAGTFDYFRLPRDISEEVSHKPFFSLSLPKLSNSRKFSHISCRADPNPTSTLRYSSQPFQADPHHAIAIFTIHVRQTNNVIPPGFLGHIATSSAFMLFVHRSSLVECLDRFHEFSDEPEIDPVPYCEWGPSVCRWFSAEAFSTRWITITAGQRCILIQDTVMESESAPFVLLNFNKRDVERIAGAERREKEEEERLRMARQSLCDQWSRSGMSLADRMNAEYEFDPGQPVDDVSGWTTTRVSDGDGVDEEEEEEEVDDASEDDWMGMVLEQAANGHDGDDWEVESVASSTSSPAPQHRRNKQKRRVKAIKGENDPLPDEMGAFQEITYSSLPYTVCTSREKYQYDGVLLDEERVIGIKTDQLQRIKALDIMHFG